MEIINCIVILQKKYLDLFRESFSGSNIKDNVQLLRVFVFEDIGEDEVPGLEVYPISEILGLGAFDYVLLFAEIAVKELMNLLYKAYPETDKYEVVNMSESANRFLSPTGKMVFLRECVKVMYPGSKMRYLSIGDFSYNSGITVMTERGEGGAKCRIGKFCSIAPKLLVLLCEEHHGDWNTTYPFRDFGEIFGDAEGGDNTTSKGNVIIGNDVWIGYGATILSGVKIGDGCIIGARAVVTKSVEPYSVVVGNPGRVVKKRFTEDKIEKLLRMNWWNWSYDMIYHAIPLLQSDKIDELWELWLREEPISLTS